MQVTKVGEAKQSQDRLRT